ncbi:hypothetical protein GCM10027342_23830 [Photobacterium alginatilyticum]
MFKQNVAFMGEHDLAIIAVEKWQLKLAFELFDGNAERRLGDMQLLGCPGEITRFGQFDEVGELTNIHWL